MGATCRTAPCPNLQSLPSRPHRSRASLTGLVAQPPDGAARRIAEGVPQAPQSPSTCAISAPPGMVLPTTRRRFNARSTRGALLRLAILTEQDDEWAVADRRYFAAESMRQL